MDEREDLVFGFKVNRKRKSEENAKRDSFAPPGREDGAVQIPATAGGLETLTHSHILSMDAGVASEAELIERYRTVATHPECDMAVEEVCNEVVVYDENQPVVALDFDQIDDKDLPAKTKEVIREEFDTVLGLLDFGDKGYDVFRRWYIDSRSAYHLIHEEGKPKKGIVEIRSLDPRKVKKFKEVETVKDTSGVELQRVRKEYYVYIDRISTYNKTFGGHPFGDAVYALGKAPNMTQGAVRISTDAVAYCHSGLVDPSTGIVYGHLQKSIKSFNQLRMLEDALVIYRLSRAPERRIFYVDVGNMSPTKAEFYVKQLQNRYRNKISYDATTGEVADKRRTMAMQEDFWLPRREGSRGTQIDTLPGGQNLGEIGDIVYFRDKLYNSLNVPPSRFKEGGMGSLLGHNSEISREEMKFAKFVSRLRTQFSDLFHQILRVQLILKRIVTEDEWDSFEDRIKYIYAKDSYYAEARDAEVMGDRLSRLGEVDPYVGRYFSMRYVQKTVLRMSDEDIDSMAKEITKEIKSGIIPDPAKVEEDDGNGFR